MIQKMKFSEKYWKVYTDLEINKSKEIENLKSNVSDQLHWLCKQIESAIENKEANDKLLSDYNTILNLINTNNLKTQWWRNILWNRLLERLWELKLNDWRHISDYTKIHSLVLWPLNSLFDSIQNLSLEEVEWLKRKEWSKSSFSERLNKTLNTFIDKSWNVLEDFYNKFQDDFDTLSKKNQLIFIFESILVAIKEWSSELISPKKIKIFIPDSVLESFSKYMKQKWVNTDFDIDDVYDFWKELYNNSDDFKKMLSKLWYDDITEDENPRIASR